MVVISWWDTLAFALFTRQRLNMVEPDGTLQNYYYREIATGRFEAGRHFITQDFIDEHTQDGWELIVVPEGQDLPDPMTHTIAPDTGEVTLKPVVNVVNKIPKLQELDTEVSNKITNGFYSIALSEGKVPPEAYFYPSDPVSQLNQLLGGLIMCKSPDGVWARRPIRRNNGLRWYQRLSR
jgi:hypothetical protein